MPHTFPRMETTQCFLLKAMLKDGYGFSHNNDKQKANPSLTIPCSMFHVLPDENCTNVVDTVPKVRAA